MNSNRRRALLVAIAVLGLGGCGTSTTVVPPCCYQGPVLSTRLAQLSVQMEDGRRLSFGEVFSGFTPREGLFTRSLPMTELNSQEVSYASLVPLLPLYDANNDGRLEEPEVLVLYAREAALATGIPMAHFQAPPGAWALATANADIAGLVAWVEARRPRMDPRAQRLFADMDSVGRDQRSSAGDMGGEVGEKFLAQ